MLMGAVLLAVALLMLMETAVRSVAARPKPFSPHRMGWGAIGTVAILQIFVGILLGITSIGAGSIIILSMVFLFRMSAREIVGSNIVIALIMVIPAGFTHYLAGGVPWPLLGMLLLGSFGGAVLGSKSTLLMPERGLKLAIVVLIVAGAVSTMAKAW
jgi:uncharacterized membrane protein YfcA